MHTQHRKFGIRRKTMCVTTVHVAESVKKMYTGVQTIIIGDSVMFGVICAHYRACISIEISAPAKEVPAAKVSQRLIIWMSFCNYDGSDFEMGPRDMTIMNAVRDELQQAVSWSSIQMVPGLNGLDEFVINRTIDTGRYDLRRAEQRSLDSEFFRTMYRMLGEFEKIAPAVEQVYAGKFEHAAGLSEILEDTPSLVVYQ